MSRTDLYKGFEQDQKRLVQSMVALGWEATPTRGRGMSMRCKSPAGIGSPMTITVNARRHGPTYDQTVAQLRTWVTTLTAQEFAGLEQALPDWMRRANAKAHAAANVLVDRMERGTTPPALRAAESAADKAARQVTDMVIADGLTHAMDTVDQVDPYVVGEKPWLAHKTPGDPRTGRKGTRYESAAVVERDWSDGSQDFACAYEGCDYTSAIPLSVARHFGSKHSRGNEAIDLRHQAPAVSDPLYDAPLATREYRPSQRLIDALADWLADVSSEQMTPAGLAESMLRWAHERPDLPLAPEQATVAPLSPDEQIERIAAIVGQPYAAEVRRLTEENEALTKERDDVIARYEGLREDVRVWRAIGPEVD